MVLSTHKKWTSLALTAILTMLLCGCQVARMAVSHDLTASTTEMPVTGWQGFGFNKPLHFGPYEATDIHRGWITQTKWGVFGFVSSNANQSYEFKLKESGVVAWEAQCGTGIQSKDLELNNFLNTGGTLEVELQTERLFVCTFIKQGNNTAWRLAMSQTTPDIVMNGVFTDGTTYIHVRGTRELSGGAWPLLDPTGYHFLLDNRIIGAVEVINNGAVWLHPSQTTELRSAVAAASSALLLYRDIKK